MKIELAIRLQMSNTSKKYFFKSNRQLIYGIALVIIIPMLVVINSLFLIKRFNKTLTLEQHRQAVLIGQITESFIVEELDSPGTLQTIVEKTIARNSELTDFYISQFSGNEFITIAAVDKERIGTPENGTAAFFAIQSKQSVARRIADSSGQYWEVHYPIIDDARNVIALLTMKFSTEAIDAETSNLIFQSFIILAVIILVIILLLASNTRLFQYAILYRRLQEIDKLKDDFISMASHELRTPITGLRNYFSMLLEGSFGKLTKKTKESIEMMQGNANRLNNLVEDLLNVSRLQQGRMPIQPSNFNVISLLHEVIDSLRATAKEKHVSLTFESIDKKISVFADQNRMRQVLVNIIGNALKYTEKGSVTLFVSSEKGSAVIKIKDTGIGISPESQTHLFEKFYRVINNRTQNIVGTGLGLWITKEILGLMSGKIYIDSIENTGTQVTMTLPLAKPLDKRK